MDPQRFDAMTKTLAASVPRRRALIGLLGGAIAAALGELGANAAPPACTRGATCQKTADCCPTERCVEGVCTSTPGGGNASCTAAGCPEIAEPCRINVCNQETGACEMVADPDSEGQSCPGTDLCFQTFTCQAGDCIGSDPVDCSTPPDACYSAGTCNSSSGECDYPLAIECGTDEVCADGDCVCVNGLVRCGSECLACCPGGTTFPDEPPRDPGVCCSQVYNCTGGTCECTCSPTGVGGGICGSVPGGEGCCSGRCDTSTGNPMCDCSRAGELCNPTTLGGPPCCAGGTCVLLPGLRYTGRCEAAS